MKRLRLLGLTLIAVFALGAGVAATASAEERGVLTLKAEAKVTMSTKEALPITEELEIPSTKAVLICKKLWVLELTLDPLAGSGEKHFNLGKDGNLHFSECKLGANSCNTEGDAKEVLLLLVDTHLINLLDKAGGKLIPGFAWLILNAKLENKPLVILCAAGTVVIEITGAFKGVVEPLSGGVITLTKEVEEVGIKAGPVVCDEVNETVCAKLLKEEPLLANGAAAVIRTTLFTLKVAPDVLWDD